MNRKITINIDSFKSVSLLDKRPDQPPNDCVAHAEQPALRPVQVHMRSPRPENPQRIESIVRSPFPHKRPNRPVPHQTIRVLCSDGRQFPFKVLLRHLERKIQMDVVRRDAILELFFHGGFISPSSLPQNHGSGREGENGASQAGR